MINQADELQLARADTIVVFLGSSGRVEKGFDLAKKGYAESLIISPATNKKIASYCNKLGWPKAKTFIEAKARTTFENALYCSDIIKLHNLKKIILVTSDFHVPRSRLLLSGMLFGNGVKIQTVSVSSRFWATTKKRVKITWNEMIKLWGSLGELVYYKIKGSVSSERLDRSPAVKALKRLLLFKI